MTTKTIPLSGGMARKKAWSAWIDPAEPPRATMGVIW